jgi:hypothetical protein
MESQDRGADIPLLRDVVHDPHAPPSLPRHADPFREEDA